MRLSLALALLAACAADAGPSALSPSKNTNRTHPQGGTLPLFQFAPPSGVGMGTACAGTVPTGTRGEALSGFARSSPASCLKTIGLAPQVIANGDLITLSANQPRVAPGPDGTPWLKLLIEGSPRTNVLQFIKDFNNAAWNLAFSGVAAPIVTANQAIAPNGQMEAERVQIPATTVSGGQYSFVYQSTSTVNPGSGFFYLRGNGTAATQDVALFGNGGWHAASCSYVSTGWTPCTNENVGVVGAGVSAIGVGNFSGIAISGGADRTAQDFFVWGGQLEQGQAVSSFIDSLDGGSQTRAAESIPYATTLSAITGAASISASFIAPVLGHAYGEGVVGLSTSTTPDGGPGIGIAYDWTGNAAPPYSAVSPTAMGCYRQAGDIPTYTADTLGLGGTQSTTGSIWCATPGSGLQQFFTAQLTGFRPTAIKSFALAPSNTVTLGGWSTSAPAFNGWIWNVCSDPKKCIGGGVPTARIAWIGDSIIYGFPDIQTSPAVQLTQLLGGSKVVVDKGTNGFRALDCSARFTSEVQGQGYSTLIWSCAVNDMAQDATGAQTAAWVEAALASALADHEKVIVTGVCPWKNSPAWTSGRQTQTVAYNSLISTWAGANGATYIDCFAAEGGQGGDPDALLTAYDSGDKIHQSAAGKGKQAQLVQAANP